MLQMKPSNSIKLNAKANPFFDKDMPKSGAKRIDEGRRAVNT
jgi:hypothetical protein